MGTHCGERNRYPHLYVQSNLDKRELDKWETSTCETYFQVSSFLPLKASVSENLGTSMSERFL